MVEYDFAEIKPLDIHTALPLLREAHPTLNKADIHDAMERHYRLFTLQKASQLVGVVGVHVYPHLSDLRRADNLAFSQETPSEDGFHCKEIALAADMTSELALLRHFHSKVSQPSLARAMEDGYRVFGVWLDDQLCSVATLIQYPHLTHGTCSWLQDGVTLPIRNYREAASALLRYVLKACFTSGSSIVSVHGRIKNRRIHELYGALGAFYTANAYKQKKAS